MDFENLEVDQSSYLDEINIVVYKDTKRRLTSSEQEQSKGFNTSKISCNASNKDLLCKSLKRQKINHKTMLCDKCSYEGTKQNLAVHRLRMHNKEYQCNKCKYQSLTEGGIERHKRIFHSAEDVRAYACNVCSYRGLTKKQLHEHTKFQHKEGVAKHPCPICRKMFKTLVQMKHHLISHSVERLYSCKGCKYRAKHRQSLHFHIRHSHPGSDAKTLFKGPTDLDFEALVQNVAKSINSSWNESRNIEVDHSATNLSDPQSGDEEQLPNTSLLEGGGVENLLIFPLGNVKPLCKDAEASSTNEIIANSSEDGSPINSLCDASFNQILVHLLGSK